MKDFIKQAIKKPKLVLLINILLYLLTAIALLFLNNTIYSIYILIFISTIFFGMLFFFGMFYFKNSIFKKLLTDEYNQIESLMYLNNLVKLPFPLSNMRNWVASPDFLAVLFRKIIISKPQVIVELGSGVSSHYIGQLLKNEKIDGKLLSIDHSEEYFKQTQESIIAANLSDYVTVHFCPLTSHKINSNEWLWYDIKDVVFPKINILIVDGPPEGKNVKARFPAIPLLIDKMANDSFIILDDYIRNSEKEIVQDWLARYPFLTMVEEISTEKGTAILQVKR